LEDHQFFIILDIKVYYKFYFVNTLFSAQD